MVAAVLLFLMMAGAASADYTVGSGGNAWSGNSTLDNTSGSDVTVKIGFVDDGGEDGSTSNWVEQVGSNIDSVTTYAKTGTRSLISNGTALNEARLAFPQKITNFSVSFSMLYTSLDTTGDIQVILIECAGCDRTNSVGVGFLRNSTHTNIIYQNNAGTNIVVKPASNETWYDVRLDIYPSSTSVFDLYVDSVLIAASIDARGNPNNFTNFSTTYYNQGGGTAEPIYIDGIRLWETTSGNLTTWHDAGSNNETYQVDVNATTPTNTNYTVWYANNGTGSYSQLGATLTGNNSLTISGTKYQNTDMQVRLAGNTTSTPELMVVTFFTQASSVGCTESITGTPPNLTGDTVITVNTTWECVRGENGKIASGYNITVGNTSQRIYFNIKNSSIDFNGSFIMGGIFPNYGNATNVSINDSVIFWNLTQTDGTKLFLVDEGYLYTGNPSYLYTNNSTFKGVNKSTRFGGLRIRSWRIGASALHTIIVKNTNISFSSFAMDFWGTGYPPADINKWKVSPGSIIENITLYENRLGLEMPNGIGVSGGVSSGTWDNQLQQFWGGDYLYNVTMGNATEGLYDPMDGAVIQDSIFYGNYTKVNIMAASNVTFQRNMVYTAMFNAGDANQYKNNTLRNNTFTTSTVNVLRDNNYFYDNIFNIPGSTSLILTQGNNNYYENSTLSGIGSGVGVEVKPSVYYTKINNNTFVNTTITGNGYWGITINKSNNTKFVDLNISYSIATHLRFGTYTTDDYTNSTGTDLINANINLSKIWFSPYANNPVNISYYADILVRDSDGNPVNVATITTSNLNTSDYPSITRNGSNATSFTTDASGHTPLPIGNDSTTMVLMNMSKNSTVQTNMSYVLNVNESSYIYPNINTSINSTGYYTPNEPVTSTTVTPNSSWYRSVPNTYQNTTTITLPKPTNWSILPDNTISINTSSDKNLTATWSGSTTVLFNTTIIEWSSQVLYLNHDGVLVDTKSSNATGFVNFTYTGTNGEFNVSIDTGFTPSNVTIACPVGWCYMALNYSNRTLLQLDNIYSTDTIQGWYNSTSQKYESHRTGYSPNQNSNVTQKHGYYYYFSTATNIPVNLTANPSITLNAGWNLVGNMNNTNRTLSALKTSIGVEATQARHFNNSLQSWQSADAETVNTGESFMVYLTSSKAWSD